MVGLWLFWANVSAQNVEGDRYKSPKGINYLVTIPVNYDDEDEHPLILFLHGGDRSNVKHHPSKYAAKAGLDFPFVVAAPHCSSGCGWASADIDKILEAIVANYKIDRERIYVTGYSMGGAGTWSTLARFPSWFAAGAPIAGSGNARDICKAKKVAIRAYHATDDSIIPYSGSKRMIDALKECNANAELKTYSEGDHWIWPQVFQSKDFYQWLLAQTRN